VGGGRGRLSSSSSGDAKAGKIWWLVRRENKPGTTLVGASLLPARVPVDQRLVKSAALGYDDEALTRPTRNGEMEKLIDDESKTR
jgi:hypothetical protein